jgi:3-oxoacyl-[acyl-carrier protein] reductase
MDLELSGKNALVTGSSRGIGLHIARRLAKESVKLGICGRDLESLESSAMELRSKGIQVISVQTDVTDAEQARNFVQRCAAELGPIHILVNNVGGSVGAETLMEANDQDWRRTFELNLFQLVRMTRLVVPHMRPTGGGAVINIASISGWHPQLSGPPQYGASKAALIFLCERMALDLAPDNIRVNTVSPGSILWEDGGWDQFRQNHPQAFARYLEEGFPMRRLGTPEEVADVVVFLASRRAHWINGRNIPVDGLEQPVPVKMG